MLVSPEAYVFVIENVSGDWHYKQGPKSLDQAGWTDDEYLIWKIECRVQAIHVHLLI